MRRFAITAVLLTALPTLAADVVRVGVFGLFHPHELIVRAADEPLTIRIANHTTLIVAHGESARFGVNENENDVSLFLHGTVIKSGSFEVSSAPKLAANFTLTVPGKLRRQFCGVLLIERSQSELAAVVSMDLETAVASTVAAESAPGAPLEALKAQAVVSRSYYLGGGSRHALFDFCDTTHCQFLRSPPPPASAAYSAARNTRGLVLTYGENKILPAMYSAYCGGRTRTLAEAGLRSEDYPYYSVSDSYCRRVRKAGLAYGPGHGLGLCQHGAAELARSGASFRDILAHYFPNTTITVTGR